MSHSTRRHAATRSPCSKARDYAIGTSSRSSKMVHGGLRYLENFDLGLVREALLERQLMVELAPHLVYPTPFLVPTLKDEKRDRKIGIGLNAYDVLAGVGGRGAPSRQRGAAARVRPKATGHRTGTARSTGKRSSRWCRPSPTATPNPPTSSTTARPTTCAWSSPSSARPSGSVRSA